MTLAITPTQISVLGMPISGILVSGMSISAVQVSSMSVASVPMLATVVPVPSILVLEDFLFNTSLAVFAFSIAKITMQGQ